MRILQANKFFYRRGGAEMVFLDTIAGLRQRGHEVAEFSAVHPKNLPSEYSAYFVNAVTELTEGGLDAAASWKAFKHLFSSAEVRKKLRSLILATEPQVAHLHNVTRQLSATIFTSLKKIGIPIVLTVHDVQPMCPNHRRLVKHTICQRCYRHRYYQCFANKCIDDSRVKSAAGALEAYYYWLRGIWNLTDIFICPSQFMMDEMANWGFAPAKLRLLRNPFAAPAQYPPLGDKIVYFGRLHEEKGIRIFMDAARSLREYQIIVAGVGPDEPWVDKYIRQYGLTHVSRLGWVGGERWKELMAASRAVVAPSLVYENCSMTILEAMANGRLVVAADRGGNSELIRTDETGFLAEPEDPDSLALFIREAMRLGEAQAQEIGVNARNWVMDNHNIDSYFAGLEKIYGEVIKK
ncbi:glycosyltransferase [Patescibacteria group bacterium]|nr:MAG: glycosyltransferase [Patescibacteria group bacterium]